MARRMRAARGAGRQLLTVDEVTADANAARDALGKMERELQEGIDAIAFKAIIDEGREMTAAELAQRDKLILAIAEVRDGFKVLGFVNAQRLNNTVEAQSLARQMQVINAGLEDDLARLEKIEKFAEISAEVADALAKAAGKLAEVAAGNLKPG